MIYQRFWPLFIFLLSLLFATFLVQQINCQEEGGEDDFGPATPAPTVPVSTPKPWLQDGIEENNLWNRLFNFAANLVDDIGRVEQNEYIDFVRYQLNRFIDAFRYQGHDLHAHFYHCTQRAGGCPYFPERRPSTTSTTTESPDDAGEDGGDGNEGGEGEAENLSRRNNGTSTTSTSNNSTRTAQPSQRRRRRPSNRRPRPPQPPQQGQRNSTATTATAAASTRTIFRTF